MPLCHPNISTFTARLCRWQYQQNDGQAYLTYLTGPTSTSTAQSEDVKGQFQSLITQLEQQHRISAAMPIETYLNRQEEIIQDCEEDIVEAIARQFDPEEPSDDDQEEEVIPKGSATTALEALNILRLYEMQQEDCQNQVVDLLRQAMEAYIRRRTMNCLGQTNDQFILHVILDKPINLGCSDVYSRLHW